MHSRRALSFVHPSHTTATQHLFCLEWEIYPNPKGFDFQKSYAKLIRKKLLRKWATSSPIFLHYLSASSDAANHEQHTRITRERRCHALRLQHTYLQARWVSEYADLSGDRWFWWRMGQGRCVRRWIGDEYVVGLGLKEKGVDAGCKSQIVKSLAESLSLSA